jgi:uncharacterized membrane protein
MDVLAPFHPALVHVPIALLIVGFLFEAAGRLSGAEWLPRAAAALLLLGALGAGAAFVSGKAAEERAEDQGVPEAPIESHESAGTATLIVAGLAAVLKLAELTVLKRRARVAGVLALVAYAAAAVLVGITGFRGGELVYKHGAGVQRVARGGAEEPGGEAREAEEHH